MPHNQDDFNPFEILPKTVMLRVLAHTFEKDANGDFKNFMDYKAVSKELRHILGDKSNFTTIMSSMPTEFNIKLITTLKHRKITNEQGRYRAGVALLFLKHLYARVKPHTDYDYLTEQFDYYYKALSHINKKFKDYPMVIYINGFVSFQIAKRLFVAHANNDELKLKAGKLIEVAVRSMIRADELEHPIAPLFHDDANLQLVRNGIKVKNWVKAKLPKRKKVTMSLLAQVLSPDKKISFKGYSDEEQDMLHVTWQKLIIEDCYNSRALFEFAVNHDLVMRLTDYFYSCFAESYFHRVVLAFNPIFTHSDCKENIIWLFNTYKVNTLVNLHQGFRVYSPEPDSVLLSVLLETPLNKVKEAKVYIDNVLRLPQQGMQGWKMNFLDAYRDSIDEGALKKVSFDQMKMVISYFSLVDRSGMIGSIMDRDAFLLCKVFHCNDDKIHKIACEIVNQVVRLSTFDPLGHLDHQEILLSYLYDDPNLLIPLEMKDESDCEQLAKIIMQSYKNIIASKLKSQPEIIVPEFIRNNHVQFNNLRVELTDKFQNMGYLKSA